MIEFINIDCMEYMRNRPDKYFDLAIVDPPTGLPKDSTHGRGKLKNRRLNNGDVEKWDVKPNSTYFEELFRISNNQIIWGGNYFGLPPNRCFICWDKVQPWDNFSQVEYAWTSFNKPSKLYKYDNRTGRKIHPTQKPIKLYGKILNDFAKPNFRIIDTHLGSGSSAIAAYDFGIQEFVCCEIDKDYYDAAMKRFKNHKLQIRLFC